MLGSGADNVAKGSGAVPAGVMPYILSLAEVKMGLTSGAVAAVVTVATAGPTGTPNPEVLAPIPACSGTEVVAGLGAVEKSGIGGGGGVGCTVYVVDGFVRLMQELNISFMSSNWLVMTISIVFKSSGFSGITDVLPYPPINTPDMPEPVGCLARVASGCEAGSASASHRLRSSSGLPLPSI